MVRCRIFYIYTIMIFIALVVVDYMLLTRYNDKKKILIKDRENELITLITYFEVYDYIFMNQEDYEQIPLMKDLITGVDFLKESDVCDVIFDTSTDTVLFAELPVKTVLEVTYTEPGEKGNTATNAMKEATVETGAKVRVPLFINTGDKIRVDTRTGEYAERVRE